MMQHPLLLSFGWCGTLGTLGCAAAFLGLFVWCITRGSDERLRAAFYERVASILCSKLRENSSLSAEALHERVLLMLRSRRADTELDGLRRLRMQLVHTGKGQYTLRLILTKQTEETTLEVDGISWSELPAEIRKQELQHPQDVQSYELAN